MLCRFWSTSLQDQSKASEDLKATTAFAEINKRAEGQPNLVKKIGAVVLFDITKGGNLQQSWSSYLFSWTFSGRSHPQMSILAIDGKQGTIYEGKPKEGTTAQVSITVDDNDFVELASGKASAPAVRGWHSLFLFSVDDEFLFDSQLFAKGKLKVKGNVMLAQKLSALFKEQSKL